VPKLPQQVLIVSQGRKLSKDGTIQFMSIPRCEIAQAAVLQPTENRFQRVEHRCVGRQLLQAQTGLETCQLTEDRLASMHLPSVPDNHRPIGDLSQQVLEKSGNLFVIEVRIDQGLKKQTQPIPLRGKPQSCRQRYFLPMFALLLELRSLPTPSPSATHQRGHQKPTFIDQNEVRTLTSRFFLIRGQSMANQFAMASGSRSRGTRCGFCGVKPRRRSQSGRYRGWNAIPHSSQINWPRRRAVHNPVGNPCSVGLSFSQRKTIFSWLAVNLHGRPATGCEAKPSQPCSRKICSHRLTVRGWTSTKSATSSMEYPSKLRRTAKQRRYSSSCGKPELLITGKHKANRLGWHYFSDWQ